MRRPRSHPIRFPECWRWSPAGVYYDDGWDRSLAAAGSATTPCGAAGTRVRWKQNLDLTPLAFSTFSGGVPGSDYTLFWPTFGGATLDATKLPRDPGAGCARVFPHQFPRVNNVFELIKAAGGRTAWADKHPAYEFLKGRSGTGIDDLYTPEIATSIGAAPAPLTSPLTALITDNFELTRKYDDLKVNAIVNEINGYDHAHGSVVGVPMLFGMNFQAVSVAQKLDMSSLAGGLRGGYNADGTPSGPLETALLHTDDSIGRMVAALDANGLLDSTLIIVSAKHGNSPVDPNALKRVDPATISSVVNSVQSGLLALLSADTGPLIWLKDQSKTAAVVAAFQANQALPPSDPANAHIQSILSGPELAAQFADPTTDSRAPDLILGPIPGTVYVAPVVLGGVQTWSKIADHGSFYGDDTHVGLLVSNPHFAPETINDAVETRQIACTILTALGLNCADLQSQTLEPSTFLPHDTTPPVLTLPADIITEATSPSGAIVTYSAAAVDAVDGPVAVTCTPASGSTFAMGTTVVNCSAADHVGNTQNGSFSVLVLTPAETVSDLAKEAENFQQATNLLQTTLDKISRGNTVAACGKLGAFINQVQAQSGKSLLAADADTLITSASNARAALSCQ
jgi:hypothetical protein